MVDHIISTSYEIPAGYTHKFTAIIGNLEVSIECLPGKGIRFVERIINERIAVDPADSSRALDWMQETDARIRWDIDPKYLKPLHSGE